MARGALEKNLALRPHDPMAHLSLAWLLYQDAMKAEQTSSEWVQAVWQGEVGEHLREVFDWKRGAEAPEDNMYRDFGGEMLFAPWIPTKGGDVAVLRILDSMDDLIPGELRFAYYLLYATHVEGIRAA